MKIAILSTVAVSVPPKGYGGTELVVSNLTEELVKRGHEVTLFSAKGAVTRAKNITNNLIPAFEDPNQNFGTSQGILDEIFISHQEEFDIVHAHTSHRFFHLKNQLKIPHVLTVHTLFRPEWMDVYETYKKLPIVSISKSQAEPVKKLLNIVATVYNGIDIGKFDLIEKSNNDYIVWLGRIVQSKGVLGAIELAKLVNKKIKIAGPFVDDKPEDVKYGEEVKEAMKSPLVEYLGEVKEGVKNKLIGGAKVFINPINWPEPFGLVAPESNACGTPIVAYARGAMPELIKDGYNGYIIKPDDVKGMAEVVKKIFEMSDSSYLTMRRNCRKHVEENFTVERMVDGYEKVYQKVVKNEI